MALRSRTMLGVTRKICPTDRPLTSVAIAIEENKIRAKVATNLLGLCKRPHVVP
jgi:hypothetical protein